MFFDWFLVGVYIMLGQLICAGTLYVLGRLAWNHFLYPFIRENKRQYKEYEKRIK